MSPPSDQTRELSQHTEKSLEPVKIEAVDGPGKGARGTLERGTWSVGSAADCDLVLADPAVSRRHVTIALLEGGVKVQDQGSRNGTRYLGAKISEAVVPVGGSILVGKTTLRISPLSGAAASLSDREELHGLIGRSLAMRRLFAAMERVGPTDSSVLLHGETGVGKGAVARALHALWRPSAPFVVMDCATVAPTLVESQLFGHAKGAFTGADTAQAGLIESAHGGTLFLDEVGELPLALQPKLLRVLETGQFQRVGEAKPRHVEFRALSATHRDVDAARKSGQFREDLYFRLAVVVMEVPPLQQRIEDIPLLVRHFAKELSDLEVKITTSTLARWQAYRWPGNVRELRNAVERTVHLGAEPEEAEASGDSYKESRDRLLRAFERDYLDALLEKHGGNVSAAARASGLSRVHLYRMLERHRLVKKS